MSRVSLLQAQQEFWSGGGEGGSMPTIPPGTYRYQVASDITATYGYQVVWTGEPTLNQLSGTPSLVLLMPVSDEDRHGAQIKFVSYTCEAWLVGMIQGDPTTSSAAANALMNAYGWVDACTEMIRGGSPGVAAAKILKTPSYPSGAALSYGEKFRVDARHDLVETSIRFTARFTIEAIEQVIA